MNVYIRTAWKLQRLQRLPWKGSACFLGLANSILQRHHHICFACQDHHQGFMSKLVPRLYTSFISKGSFIEKLRVMDGFSKSLQYLKSSWHVPGVEVAQNSSIQLACSWGREVASLKSSCPAVEN
jgi:hypothetical protein